MVNAAPPLIVLDACVLAGTLRRHMLLSFADAGIFRPVWSARICDETLRAIPKTLKSSDIHADQLEHHAQLVCDLMVQAFPVALCQVPDLPVTGVTLPDPDDEHVVALALHAGTSLIVTENLRDFPKKQLAPLGLKAISTDAFLASCAALSPRLADQAIANLIRRIGRVDVDRAYITTRLRGLGFRKTATFLSGE